MAPDTEPDSSSSPQPSAESEAARAMHLPPDDRFVPLRLGDLADLLARGGGPSGMVGLFDALAETLGEEARAFERDLEDRYAPFNPDRDTLLPGEKSGAACEGETAGGRSDVAPAPVRSSEDDADLLDRVTAEQARRRFPFRKQIDVLRARIDDLRGVEPEPEPEPDSPQRREAYRDLLKRLGYLLDKANFERLSDVQIERAIAAASGQGMRVRLRPEMIDELTLFVRGRHVVSRRRRKLTKPIKGEMHELDTYRRLVVVGRLRGSPHVILKLFRDIPIADVEALLPHAEVRMTLFDRVKVLGGGAGAFGTLAGKLIGGALGAAALAKLGWLVLSALGLLVLRTFFGYRRARVARNWQRTRHLYFQNVANNAGVLHTLVAMVEQEETKEAVLAYAAAAGVLDAGAAENGGGGGASLAAACSGWLRNRFGVDVQFDAADALETLERLGLLTGSGGGGGGRVLPPAEGARVLDEYRRRGDAQRYHEACVRSRG